MGEVDVNREFVEFGNRMNIVMICILLNFVISGIASLIGFIFMILSLKNIKRINFKLNNPNLQKFRSLYISSILISIISSIVLLVAMIPLIIGFFGLYSTFLTYPFTMPDINFIFMVLIYLIVILVIALLILIISGILLMNAWDNMNIFFIQNQDLFPPIIAQKCIEGSKNLKTAGLCTALSILIIPAIIGLIYQIMGYSKISKLKDMDKYGDAPQSQPIPIQTGSTLNYCPYCGEQTQPGSSFCMKCGQEL